MKRLIIASFILISGLLNSCMEDEIIRYKDVEIKNTDTYKLDLEIRGANDGARIVKQAQHHEVSGFIRGEETNFSIYYHYKPKADYVGPDEVEIETCKGEGDERCNKNLETLIIRFTIVGHNE